MSNCLTPNDLILQDAKLHEEWFASYGQIDLGFIYDGATDPALWLKSRWRIMGLLKELHGGGKSNHAEKIKECNGLLKVGGTANQATHNRMVEWLYAIECVLEQGEVDVESDRANNYPKSKETMMRSAWVNIKKANGVAYSNNDDLRHVVKIEVRFILRQIEMLNPRLILCGKTFDVVKDFLFPDCVRIPNTAFSYQQRGGRVVLDYIHPARKSLDSYKELAAEVLRLKKAGVLIS